MYHLTRSMVESMLTLHENSKYLRCGNWIVNLSVVLCYSNIIMLETCERSKNRVILGQTSVYPANWPCQWNNGVIPFAFDYFALSPKRLISYVRKAHTFVEERSCLVFKEMNPVDCAAESNFTYLFYTYSEVLENCCLKFFTKNTGRRLVLITPTCFLQVEVAHATLHGLGLEHKRDSPFTDSETRAVLFPYMCNDMHTKISHLEGLL